ncbi:MAG: HsdR family type I site-specific deoxyribonuclease [Actinomycetota bacterium]|nr:HsdR family type I site-specific deoxyribonuclease [Rubrobacter sp.]MDQ3509241.1 HsdR family type I site-specific deoxyribonuclease [Actinomycetota bacterium]
MSDVGQKERPVQNRVVKLLCDRLGYRYLGDRQYRPTNRNIEEGDLRAWLEKRGVPDSLITRALRKLTRAAAIGEGRDLYEANREVYGLLRYGVKVREAAGEQNETIHLIDWKHPENNDFAIAEEVTVLGKAKRRPDIVLYVNGIALGVLELKRSTVSVGEGVRQNYSSQRREAIGAFFTTMQFVMAANDTEGLRYGTIGTPEKHYLRWREEGEGSEDEGSFLDRDLLRVCDPARFLEIIHDFTVFDAGTKKVCRHNQFFGVRAARERIRRREGGIIWHTQGSGKSLTMVWLAKWIYENIQNARVLIVTDRTELDEQIEQVFRGVDENICRAESGADLVAKLDDANPPLLSSLVHKFGRSGDETDGYVRELRENLPEGFRPKGEIFVFVDECHRTQAGKLHEAMKGILPGATFIGFTGTPLLKKDKQKSIEVFGSYIHTYKYDEAVRDGAVLDLRYEARDIDQNLTSPERVDKWFEAKTRGLSDAAKVELKKKWGTMRKVHSSRDRLGKIADDILLDMETRDRLMSRRGNAMLVSGSIYQACKLYEMFSRTDLAGKCAIITSYSPNPGDIRSEDSGEGETEKLRKYAIYRKMLADYFDASEDAATGRAEEFETKVKEAFKNEPGRMRLLIVVDKLLTGFDAPPATYLYIDKKMRDHGLFQAICRVNRLDGEDKEYGYVIDYKDLFNSLESAVADYTGEAFEDYDEADVAGLLENRLEKAKERLEETRERVRAICEPVRQPRNTMDYFRYFVGDASDEEAKAANERRRVAFYRAVSSFVRSYANLANEMPDAGHTKEEAEATRREVLHYENVRREVKINSADYLDMKSLEPAMRHLLDTYIRAEESEKVSAFDELGVVDLLVKKGKDAVSDLPEGIRGSGEAVSETIENNVRKVITDKRPTSPKYYERMSELLDALIRRRREEAVEYKEYLERLVELAREVREPSGEYPGEINTSAKRALYDNLDRDEELSIRVDAAVRHTREDEWRGHRFKERKVRGAIREELGEYKTQADEIFEIVKSQSEY